LPPPTTHLPPIGKIRFSSIDTLLESLKYLRLIYNPEVRGSRRINRSKLTPRPLSTISPDTSALDALRADAFERTYALRWLTAVVAQCADDAVLDAAAALLALCAGPAAAGTVTRAFTFGDATVQLTDAPLENGDFGTVGAQTWGSACVLAEMLVEAPAAFGLRTPRPLRVLELGAGTGLVSLMVGKYHERCAASGVEIVASDFHPSVLANLRANIKANFPSPSPGLSISAQFLDWSDASSLQQAPFDVVFGADIVYDVQHAAWIKATLEWGLRRPGSALDRPAKFHLMIPLRPLFLEETGNVEQVFPMASASESDACSMQCSWDLRTTHKEIIVCEARSDGKGEVEYAYYIIEW
ncbi:hypothetical protein BV25DRAFT_1788636, partial [Artomyces pyxidatus]